MTKGKGGLSTEEIRAGVEMSEDDLDACLQRNIDRGLIEIIGVDAQTGSPVFRLTPSGVDFIEAMGQPTLH